MVRVITSGLLVVVVFVVSIHFNKIQEYCLSAVAGRGLIGTWQLHAASSLRSATYISKHAGANQIATRLLRHCSGPARCCSQPAGCYRPTACCRTDRSEVTAAKVWAYLHALLEKCHYFRNDGPYRHKTQHMSCTWSVRVCVPNFAVVRRGV